jgi:dihydrofolate reductase
VKVSLVVAIAQNGVIGRDGGLPWHLPEDLRHFRRVTTGHAIIMGRKTWDSIGRPLPKRRSIVVSRQPALRLDGAEVAGSLDEALALAAQTDPEPMVIGGASMYEAALPRADRIYLTEVLEDAEGDVRFPLLDRSVWREIDRREIEGATFLTLERPQEGTP